MRLPPEVLPVVSVRTLRLIMILVDGTPLCLEKEQVKVDIPRHVLDQPHLQIVKAVGEGTKFSILALVGICSKV